MGLPRDIVRDNPGLAEWAIVSAYRGSIAHGMYTAQSEETSIDDKDIMAVCVPPLKYYFGLKEFGSRGTQELKRDEWDIVIYEARKFVRLLAQGNPNVLGMLWLEPNYYLKVTPAFALLKENRKVFVGKHVYRAFTGYAYGQLHRMTHAASQGYMGAKRKALVEKFGYDCKNAAHLIRLLRMGAEFLQDGELYILRHDAQQLLEIKRGEWSLTQVKIEAEHLFKMAEKSYLSSTLPTGPNMELISDLAMKVVQTALENRADNIREARS